MKNFLVHARTYIIRGLLALIPLFLAYLAIKFLYVFIDKKIIDYLAEIIGYRIPGLGFLLFVVFLYLVGMITSNVLGKRLFSIVDKVCHRIPLINTVYQVGKQISETLSLPEKQIFRKAVLVEMKKDFWVIGFITGSMTRRDEETKDKSLRVFIPHVPNPTTGFVVIVKESEIIDPQWTVDEAVRAVISGGIIGPDQISFIREKMS